MSDLPLNAPDMSEGMDLPRPTTEQAPLSPGATLAAAREAYGLSVQQVANQLNLAPRQVVALEADDYAALPGMVIVRGFLRGYAKLLRIDPAPLIAALSVQNQPSVATPMRHTLSASFAESRLPPTAVKSRRSNGTPIAAGFALLLAVGAVSYAMGWWPESLVRTVGQWGPASRDATTPDPEAFASDASDATNLTVASEINVGANTNADAPLSGPAAVRDAGDTSVLMPTTTLSGTALQIPSAGVAGSPGAAGGVAVPAGSPAAVPSANPLVLTIQKDSWVEIKRADNTAVVARVIKAGSVETFNVSEPLTLTIGNVAGVEASLRGAPLALAGAGSGNVARLQVK